MPKVARPLIERKGYFEVPLSNGQIAKISEQSAPFVASYCWTALSLKSGTYAYRTAKDGRRYLHRYVVECSGMDIPDEYVVDHINRNPLDNRLENLRLATRAKNCRNNELREPKLYYSQRSGLWRATVSVIVPLGVYKTKAEAVEAYRKWLEEQA